jgi:DNA-binding response OmpR family regulator
MNGLGRSQSIGEERTANAHRFGNGSHVGTALHRGAICMDFERFAAHANGRVLTLTRLEFDLLAYLMRHAHRVVSQEELVQRVIHGVYRAESSLIRVHVAHLRRKLGLQAGVIETVRGRGLRFLDTRITSENGTSKPPGS